MRVLILNGNPNPDNRLFDDCLSHLAATLTSRNHSVTPAPLRDLHLKRCTGCFGCWDKTPGECVLTDDSHQVSRNYINSDLVIFASPILMGFTSSLLKTAHDRFIPLILPYLEFIQDECHHKKRYGTYPSTALLLEKSKGSDDEDIRIISDIYKRDAINYMASYAFTAFTDNDVERIADEIDSL